MVDGWWARWDGRMALTVAPRGCVTNQTTVKPTTLIIRWKAIANHRCTIAKTIMVNYKIRSKVKAVKGTQNTDASAGKNQHGRFQVLSDRHSATDRNMRNKIRISTWNVRTLCSPVDEKTGVNSMGVSEMRWTGLGKVVLDDYTYIYSGGSKNKYRVGMVIDKETSKSIVAYLAVSDRVLLVKLQGKPVNLSVIHLYAPTNDAIDTEKKVL